jgi:hypothetical protein
MASVRRNLSTLRLRNRHLLHPVAETHNKGSSLRTEVNACVCPWKEARSQPFGPSGNGKGKTVLSCPVIAVKTTAALASWFEPLRSEYL